MAANGISTLATKQARQAAKLVIATAKRQGKVVATNGTVTGSVDATKPYYRATNTLDTTLLPTLYSSNTVVNNVNTVNSVSGVLVAGRPWSNAPVTSYVGTIDSSVGNPFTFKVRKSDNLGMAAAITNTGWILTWTDPRFDNGGFTADQINVRTQTGSGFTSVASEDATFYNFAGWFGASVIPQGTQFTINWS